jgi:hypothetical protein
MIWTSLITVLELFVLPALAAVAANFAFLQSDKQLTTRRTVGRLVALTVAAYATAIVAQCVRVRIEKPASLVIGENLSLSYLKPSSALKMNYDLSLVGDTHSGFLMTDMTGTLSSTENYQRETIPLSLNDFTCTSEGKPIGLPHSIGPSSSQDMNCTLSFTLTPMQSETFFSSGARELVINIASDSSLTLTKKFCFSFTQELAEEFAKSPFTTRRFIDAGC